MLNDIPNEDINFWIKDFKPYQKEKLLHLFEIHKDGVKVAELWTEASGLNQTETYGGSVQNKRYFDELITEFNKLICGDQKYKELIDKLKSHEDNMHTMFVTTIAAVLAPKFGVAIALLSPAIACLLYAVGSVGRNAYCNLQ